jgi:dipeptidyl aminopeptidase/acylaminoacyl peptidase
VTLSLLDNPGDATLTGIAGLVTDAAGLATFSNLSLDAVDAGYTLRATASGAVSATSSPFDVVNEIRLTTDSAVDMDPKWSPDGSRVVFSRFVAPTQQVFVVGADGTGETQLTSGSPSNADAAWLPDGRILFVSGSEIYRMNADGTGRTALTRDSLGSGSFNPSSSPDGSRIVFAGGFGPDIYVMDADGTNRVQLTDDTGKNRWPVWSPDATKIAFASDRSEENWDIWVMNANGTGQTQLTGDPGDDSMPSWYPNGDWVAYGSEIDCSSASGGDDAFTACEIYVMNADGSDQANLTESPDVPDAMPDWSPDGTRIVFVSTRGENTDVYVLSPAALLRARVSGP